MVRYIINFYWNVYQPIPTLIINIIGSFILALLYSVITEQFKWNNEIRWTFGTGLLGAFTTYSTFTVDVVQLIEGKHIYHAFLYILMSVLGGGLASLLAIIGVSRWKRNGGVV